MQVEQKGDEVIVSGNECKRGEAYATTELTCPTRTLTSSIFIDDGDCPLLSVKTKEAIPKEKLLEALELLRNVRAKAPVNIGDVIIPNIVDTNVDLVATRRVLKAN